MDDEKAVGMTTDAKPLPLSADELAATRMLSPRILTKLEHRLIATIADLGNGIEVRTRERDANRVYANRCEADTKKAEALLAERDATIAQQAEQIAELRQEIHKLKAYGWAWPEALNQRGDNE